MRSLIFHESGLLLKALRKYRSICATHGEKSWFLKVLLQFDIKFRFRQIAPSANLSDASFYLPVGGHVYLGR